MKELSLNVLDIAMNSVKAGAKNILITIDESDSELSFTVADDGCGMTGELLERVTDPFCTSRKTRKVGLGIPFLKLMAEQTGGNIFLESRAVEENPQNHGTRITALFYKNHIDCLPLGDMVSTVVTLIQGSPLIDFEYKHTLPTKERITLSTVELRSVLGDTRLDEPEVVLWIRDYLKEQYEQVKK